MASRGDQDLAQVFAGLARELQAEETLQSTLDRVVAMATTTISGCDHAGISWVSGRRIDTPAASDEIPERVDDLQYQFGEGPCLSAIREQGIFQTDDLLEETRWPGFSSRVTTETGIRSMLSFRLFARRDTLGALNLYSREPSAFGLESRSTGAVFAAHAAMALAAAGEHDRAVRLQRDLAATKDQVRGFQERIDAAVALQRSLLSPLPDLGMCELAARYVPASGTAEVGGDWYDAFLLSGFAVALVVGDVTGHDTGAAIKMGQLRTALRTLALDRQELPGALLQRFDGVVAGLGLDDVATCVYGVLRLSPGTAPRLEFSNAGHPPPLLVTREGTARYLETPEHLLLGMGREARRSTSVVALPPGSTLVLYTDGLVEHRGVPLNRGLERLRQVAAALHGRRADDFCDAVVAELAPRPSDDVCVLALRLPDEGSCEPTPPLETRGARSQHGKEAGTASHPR